LGNWPQNGFVWKQSLELLRLGWNSHNTIPPSIHPPIFQNDCHVWGHGEAGDPVSQVIGRKTPGTDARSITG